MKKIFNWLIVIMVVVTLTGCGKSDNDKKELTPLEVINNIFKNQTDSKSAKADIVVDLKATTQGMSVDSKFNLSFSFEKDNENYKGMIELSDNPLVGEIKTYFDANNEKISYYIPSKIYDLLFGFENDETIWIKGEEETSFEDVESKDIDVTKFLTDNDFVFVSKNENIYTCNLVLSNDLLNRVNKYFDPNSTDVINDLNNNVNVTMTIDTENNRIVSLSIDVMKLFDNLNLDKEEMDYTEILEKFILTLNVSYDNINVTIPEDVINSSITAEEYFNKIS